MRIGNACDWIVNFFLVFFLVAHRSQTSSISPTKVPCTMAHIKHERNFVKNETDESSLKHYSNRESLDFDEILKAVEEAHQKRTNISTARNDVLLQRNCETTMNNTISQERPNSNGSSVLNQHKISGKEISWDLSRDLRQRNDRKVRLYYFIMNLFAILLLISLIYQQPRIENLSKNLYHL